METHVTRDPIGLTIMDLPIPMLKSWNRDPIRKIWIHKLVEESLTDALQSIGEHMDREEIPKYVYSLFGGSLRYEPSLAGAPINAEAFGIAFRINPHLCPFGSYGKQPRFIVNAFLDRGWYWCGGDVLPDASLFMAARGI